MVSHIHTDIPYTLFYECAIVESILGNGVEQTEREKDIQTERGADTDTNRQRHRERSREGQR